MASTRGIPHEVHIIWIQGESHLADYRPSWARDKAAWGKFMPTWRLNIWDDESIRCLLEEHYPGLIRIYSAPGAPMAWKADVARYAIVHKHGGLYADATYQVIRPFDWMLGGPIDLVFMQTDLSAMQRSIFGHTNNCWFAAAPGHPAMAAMVTNLATSSIPTVFSPTRVLEVTGPRKLWTVFNRYKQLPTTRVIPASAVDPIIARMEITKCTDERECQSELPFAVAIHRSQMSYVGPVQRFAFHGIQFFRRNSGVALIIMFVCLCVVVVALCMALSGRRARREDSR